MRNPCLTLALSLCVVLSSGARADPEGTSAVGQRLDAAVAAAVGGQLAPAADDATFLRRVWLDLAGHVPPAQVVRAFLDDRDPGKRARMVDRLLESGDFADHWARVLAVAFTGERPIVRGTYDGKVLHEHLRERLAEGDGYDRIVRDLLVGSGPSDSSGPANFLLRFEADPPRLAGAVGKNLLGVTIQCAQCHDHPFAKWKEEDFWGIAAAFARVRRMDNGELKAIVEARRGELMRPDPNPPAEPEKKAEGQEGETPAPKEIAVRPRLLNGRTITQKDRRAALADWVVARDSPLFARNAVNRAWEQLFGRALVANLDDPDARPDSLPVLDLLAEDFAGHGYDLRRLVRTIVLSEGYAQTSSPRPKPSWARPTARPLSVDQLHASIAQATGYDGSPDPVAEEPPGDGEDEAESNDGSPSPDDDDQPEPAPDGADHPADALGERVLTVQRALVLINGEFVKEASRTAARIARATQKHLNNAERLEWACLATLGRAPNDGERAVLRALQAGPNGLEDVYWVLLNASEFQEQF